VKGGAGLALSAKIAAGVALAGGALWAGGALLKSDAGNPRTNMHQAQPSHLPAPAEQKAEVPSGATQNVPEPARPPAKSQQSANVARAASSATTLAEEGRLLAKAHQLVQSGQPQQALEILRLSESRYPGSVLYQEREVLIIEALGATGASGAAGVRAERFLKRYPKSPHAGRVERFVK
jgi:TolA-binding protein